MLSKTILVTALLGCFLAVAIGAFGAHALMPLLIENDRVMTFETASSYHFYHALSLLFIAYLTQSRSPNKLIFLAFICMVIGIVIFSGSLYVLSITNQAWLGAITPIGGIFLLLSWGLLIRYAFRHG